MIAELRSRSNWALGTAFVLWVGGTNYRLWYFDSNPLPPAVHWTSLSVLVVSVLLAALGCANYSAAKGYRRIWGALALLSLVGLIVLLLLPDLHPDDDAPAYRVRPDDSPPRD